MSCHPFSSHSPSFSFTCTVFIGVPQFPRIVCPFLVHPQNGPIRNPVQIPAGSLLDTLKSLDEFRCILEANCDGGWGRSGESFAFMHKKETSSCRSEGFKADNQPLHRNFASRKTFVLLENVDPMLLCYDSHQGGWGGKE